MNTFEGFDWMEISEVLNIVNSTNKNIPEVEILKLTKEHLQKNLHTENEKQIADYLRLFLKKLYENSLDYKQNANLWKGLLEIEDDFTLIKYAIVLLEHMSY